LSVIRKPLDLFPSYASRYIKVYVPSTSMRTQYVHTYTCKAPTDQVMQHQTWLVAYRDHK